MSEKKSIEVQVLVQAPVQKVWQYFTEPQHITQWYFASDDWHAPSAENDVRPQGRFKTHMAAKDGSFAFDLEGVYTLVQKEERLEFTLPDGRRVKVIFKQEGKYTRLTENFEPEQQNPEEMQKQGWQAILNNFKKHVENN